MHHLTLRNVDPAVDAALRDAAARDCISKAEAARRALAKGLGVTLRRRDLSNLGAAILTAPARATLAAQDWEAPDFDAAALEALEAEAQARGG